MVFSETVRNLSTYAITFFQRQSVSLSISEYKSSLPASPKSGVLKFALQFRSCGTKASRRINTALSRVLAYVQLHFSFE